MLGISHLLISGTASSLLLQTADPVLIAVGAIGGLLPDVDVSTSPAGKVFPWISGYFQETMPHRSMTHSIVASAVVAIASYGTAIFIPQFIPIASALTIGYTFGWFADCFTRGGVEMFWPSPVRCVCPGNRNLRLKTGSNAEYFILCILIAIALSAFSINSKGGILTQFNRLIASTSGVQGVYNSSGSTHKIIANIKGVRAGDRSKVDGQFQIIQPNGTGFIVLEPKTNKLYKAATEPDSQIVIEQITADVSTPAITTIESVFVEDQVIGEAISKFNRTNTNVFISGDLSVEDFDTSVLPRDPYQFKFIDASPSNIKLEAAPLKTVIKFLGDEFATGSLQIRSIVSSQ
ncbi:MULTISPECIES: metal-dependent hydrolase [unclassified Dolichospermum]|uniref:metal-dependent hydrolase n=1 Tax=unclassified Dolichospermum TaxID=2622029 RepID=UPI0014476EFE|nr:MULTISPECIES: metal-dependent hydrolase [unclassified Dolichospermum]MTJ15531.1 metal-dependent hydrolase [Dolichospermum sp. UHCC 0299]MTJ41366.1 metal-dependent hydrolase [Dolichospermum sp. UHCC 0406]